MPFLPTFTLPLDFVRVSIIVVPVIPSPHCPLPTPLWLLFTLLSKIILTALWRKHVTQRVLTLLLPSPTKNQAPLCETM